MEKLLWVLFFYQGFSSTPGSYFKILVALEFRLPKNLPENLQKFIKIENFLSEALKKLSKVLA